MLEDSVPGFPKCDTLVVGGPIAVQHVTDLAKKDVSFCYAATQLLPEKDKAEVIDKLLGSTKTDHVVGGIEYASFHNLESLFEKLADLCLHQDEPVASAATLAVRDNRIQSGLYALDTVIQRDGLGKCGLQRRLLGQMIQQVLENE